MIRDVFLSRLKPFSHSNFRRFYFVQTLSTIGKWSHDLARAWIIVEMFGKAGALGTLLLATAVPSLFFILYGGVLVDKINVKGIFMVTSAFIGVASLVLAALVEYSEIQFWHLLVFGVIEGLVMAFKSPAFQSLTVRLVPREDFQQALALNSMNFHLGRTLGPLLAGLLMAWKGPSAVFLFDAITYFVLVLMLMTISLNNTQRSKATEGQSALGSLKAGLLYIWQTPYMRYKVIQLLAAISLIFPVIIVIFRTFIAEKFDLNSEQFGYVFTWPALGAAIGSISIAVIKPKRPLRALILGVPLTTISMIAVTLSNDLFVTCVLMAICGISVFLSFVSLTMSLHLDVEEDFRGRMSSLIGMGFLSLGPLMSFPIGVLADLVGFETSVIGIASCYFVLSGILATLHWKQWESQVE